MTKRKLLPILITSLLITPHTTILAKEDSGMVSSMIKGALTGMAKEAGKRLMETIFSDNTNTNQKGTWYIGMFHPTYDHVVASEEKGKWIPENGYIWSDFNNKNDWTVILKGNKVEEKIQNLSINYTLTYKGKDGMNIRATPGGKHILASTFYQKSIPLVHIPSQNNVNGNWKKFKITGWMVEKNHHNHHQYLSTIYDDISTIIWDGNGNLKDNFINLRTDTNFSSKIVAKVFTNTSVRIIDRKRFKQYQWVKVELIGWIKVQTLKGKKYLIEI